jgi:hypothetical protein
MNVTTLALSSGHFAMLSHPTDVTKFVETAATSLKPQHCPERKCSS